jgi:hypothetical protein
VTDVTLNAGDTLQFTTLIYGENFPSQDVTYTLTDPKGSATGTVVAQDAATTIDPATGKLTVGRDELNTGFTVKVTSAEDPTFTQSITVNVTMPFESFVYDLSFASDPIFGSTSTEVILFIGADPDNNYMVDWGDGTADLNDATHDYAAQSTYNSSKTKYTITVSGRTPGGISFISSETPWRSEQRLVAVTAPLLQCSSTTANKFDGCSNLATIPSDLFVRNPQITSFQDVFYGCASLISVPGDLFANNTHATSFIATFRGCTSLTAIPENLFASNTKTTTFTYAFDGCTGLTTIPENLFASNTKTTTFTYAFRGCTNLTSIPENIFANNIQVMTFRYAFSNCTGLIAIPENLFSKNLQVTDFYHTFEICTNLNTVPENLFSKNTEVTSFQGIFAQCSLASIPEHLFDNNTKVTTFRSAFYGCTNLTSIPEHLFDKNIQATTFYSAFYNCTSLTTIPKNLFDNNTQVTTFYYAFQGCTGIGSSTDLPDWWNDAKYPAATYPQFHLTGANALRMFTGCANARNFSSVPTTPLVWK